jgi:hypothetical protein
MYDKDEAYFINLKIILRFELKINKIISLAHSLTNINI